MTDELIIVLGKIINVINTCLKIYKTYDGDGTSYYGTLDGEIKIPIYKWNKYYLDPHLIHYGDCTNNPITCTLCEKDGYKKIAKKLILENGIYNYNKSELNCATKWIYMLSYVTEWMDRLWDEKMFEECYSDFHNYDLLILYNLYGKHHIVTDQEACLVQKYIIEGI